MSVFEMNVGDILSKVLEARLGDAEAKNIWAKAEFDYISGDNMNAGMPIYMLDQSSVEEKLKISARWADVKTDAKEIGEDNSRILTVKIIQYDNNPAFEVDIASKTKNSAKQLLEYREFDDERNVIGVRRFQESGRNNTIAVQQVDVLECGLKVSYLDKNLQSTNVPDTKISDSSVELDGAETILAAVDSSKAIAAVEHKYNVQAPVAHGLVDRLLGR
jgi:hypothetical protein